LSINVITSKLVTLGKVIICSELARALVMVVDPVFLGPVSVIRGKRRDRMARKAIPSPLVTELGFIGLAGDALVKGI